MPSIRPTRPCRPVLRVRPATRLMISPIHGASIPIRASTAAGPSTHLRSWEDQDRAYRLLALTSIRAGAKDGQARQPVEFTAEMYALTAAAWFSAARSDRAAR